MKCLRGFLFSLLVGLLTFPLITCSQEKFASAKSDSALLILNKAEATLVMVDGETLEIIAKIPTGAYPHEVITSADGKTAYVTNYGAGIAGNSISVIDLVKKKEIKRVDLGLLTRPHGIIEAGGNIYFTAEGSQAVARYNPKTDSVDWTTKTDQRGTHMLVITRDGKKIYTANMGSDTITVIGTDAAWTPKQISVGLQPEAIDLSPDGKELWIGERATGNIVIIDTSTDTVIEKFRVGQMPIRLKFMPDGKRVLVSDARAGEFVIVDAKTRKEIKRVSVGGVPVGIQIQPDGKRAFVALTRADIVKVFDTEKLEFIKDIRPGDNPDGMAWTKYK